MSAGHIPSQWSSVSHVNLRSKDQPSDVLVPPVRVAITLVLPDSKVTEMSKVTPLDETKDAGQTTREAPHADRSSMIVFELLSEEEPMVMGTLYSAMPVRFENRPAGHLMH